MKKNCLIALLLLICISGFSQKVKIKKDVISLDDTEVGRVEKYKDEKSKETNYTYSDLEGKNKFTLIRYYLGQDSLFFVVQPNFTKDTAEIKMQYLYFTLNEQSGLTDLLVKKYHFFDKNGMNLNAINEYLPAGNEQQIPLILKGLQEKKQAGQMQKQAEEKQAKVVRDMDIRISGHNIRIGSRSELAGTFGSAPNPDREISKDNPIAIKDEAGNIIANLIACSDFNTTVTTYDKNTFEVKTSTRYDKKSFEYVLQKHC